MRDQIVRELTEQNDGDVPDNLQLYLDENGDIAAAEVDGVPVYMDADLEQQFAAELEERSQQQATELALAEESDTYIDALSGTLDDVWSNTDDQYYTALGASNQRFDELTAPELGSVSEREHLAAYPEWREPLIADHDAWVDSMTTSGRQAAEFPLVAAETAGTLGWNAYTMSVAGVSGLAVTPFKGREGGAQTIDAFMANYGYTPKLDGTRHTFDAIGQVFAPIDEQLQNAGNATLDTTGSPFLATTVHISPDLVGTLFGGLPGSARATVKRAAPGNAYSELSVVPSGNYSRLDDPANTFRSKDGSLRADKTHSQVTGSFVREPGSNPQWDGYQVISTESSTSKNSAMVGDGYEPAWREKSTVETGFLKPGAKVEIIVNEGQKNRLEIGDMNALGRWLSEENLPLQVQPARDLTAVKKEWKNDSESKLYRVVLEVDEGGVGVSTRRGEAAPVFDDDLVRMLRGGVVQHELIDKSGDADKFIIRAVEEMVD